MKIRASSILKNILLVVVGVVKAKTMALKAKTSGLKTRLLVLGLLHNKKVLMNAIHHKIHALISSHANGEGDAHFAEDRNKAIMAYASNDDAESRSPSHFSEPAGYYDDDDDDDDNYPDLRHSLFELEDEDDDEEELELGDDAANGSVIELVRNAKEDGTEFSLEDEIDHVADVFIKRFRKQIRMQKLESFKSEEEARMSIYSVSTKHYFAFGCKVSEEISYKIKPLKNVRWVLPDSYLDVKNKDYGGEPFIDGKAVPYDPKYHEEWVRNNARAQERSRRNDRPRNFDRSRNFERRRENMQNFQNREAPPVQNQEFQNIPSQNTTQHTPQAPPPPVRDGATPNFQSQMPPNAQGYVPTYQGGSQGYQGGPGGPGYQGDQGFQSGFSRPSYPRGNPAGPPTGYQVNYQGGSSARPGPDTGYQGGIPSGYQGGSSARPGPDTGYLGGSGYQGGNPSGYQGGSSVPTNTYPSGYQGGAPEYRGGSPSGHQGFNQPYQGQGVASDYQPPNFRYQGGNQSNQQGGGGDQGGAPAYPGRDLPGRDQ